MKARLLTIIHLSQALISGLYVIAYRYLNGIEHGAHEIVSRLRARGRHYDPETYNMLDLLTVLIPAQKLPPAVVSILLS
jgi:hypothetical protein